MSVPSLIDQNDIIIDANSSTSIPCIDDAIDLDISPALTTQHITIRYQPVDLDDMSIESDPITIGEAMTFTLDLNAWDSYHAGASLIDELDATHADLTDLGFLLFRRNNTFRQRWELTCLGHDQVIALERFWIATAWQNRGIGTAVLQRLLAYWHANAGIVTVMPVPIMPGTGERLPNEDAAFLLPRLRRFYRHLGFRPQARSTWWVHL